jgi:hypothetical protein
MGVLAYNLLHMIRQFYVWDDRLISHSIDRFTFSKWAPEFLTTLGGGMSM